MGVKRKGRRLEAVEGLDAASDPSSDTLELFAEGEPSTDTLGKLPLDLNARVWEARQIEELRKQFSWLSRGPLAPFLDDLEHTGLACPCCWAELEETAACEPCEWNLTELR